MKTKYMTVLTIVLLITTLIPLSAILIPRVAAAPTGPDIYEYLPDNCAENATVIGNEQTQSHNIYPVGDVDWLELRIDNTTKAIIETFGSSGDTEMWLYNFDWSQVLQYNDDKASGNYFSQISANLGPGIYYIKIDGKSQIFDYTIKASYGRLFQRTYGTSNTDNAYAVQKTSDGGYIITGYTVDSSTSKEKLYLLKTDSNGGVQWQSMHGSNGNYEGGAVQQTSDGGYIVAGYTDSDGSSGKAYLEKSDSNGNLQWGKLYGTGTYNSFWDVQIISGGYIMVGQKDSDAYLVMTDSNGNVQWQRTYGGSSYDWCVSVRQTSGGYILAGYTTSYGSGGDGYLVKTDSNGNMQWQKNYGGSNIDYFYSVKVTSDGGYILTGTADNTFQNNQLYGKMYLVKTDSNGNVQWQQKYGTYYCEVGNSVQQTSDGGYVVAGEAYSPGTADDVRLLKTDSNGNMQWQQTYGNAGTEDVGWSMQQTWDGGYIITGYTNWTVGGDGNVYLIKTDQLGNSPRYGDVVIDEGTSTIPKVVYEILHDPPGDNSFSDFVEDETNGWDFTLSAQTTLGVDFDAHINFLGSGVSSERGFTISVGGSGSKSVEVTTEQAWTSVVTTDPQGIGPGRGDYYVGEAWLLHYRVVDRTYPDGSHAKIVLYGPTSESGFMLTAYQIKQGAVPEPYRSQMLALDPAQDNIITQDEANKLQLVEKYEYSGGGHHTMSFARTERNTRTFTFGARMTQSTATQLGFSYGPIDAGGKVTVTFSFETGITYESSTETKTRAGFDIFDDDLGDRFQYTAWYDPVFGTYLFNASGRNIGMPGTSNPRELWDNRAPTASNLHISPSNPKTTDTLTVLYTYSDPDGDPESGTQIWWYKGILHQTTYDNQHQIPAGVAKKGESWAFTVHPSDGMAFGDWAPPASVVIANSPPVASDVRIVPHNPLKTNGLTAHYQYSDVDGDPESGTQIRWYKNGVLQSVYNDQLTVPPNALTKGNSWYFTVQPKDGTAFGSLQTSPTETIQNSAPTASSVHLTPDYPKTTDNLNANYNYNDADGDPESGTQILWYKDGVRQTAYDNVRTVPYTALSNGQYWYFTVQPKDGALFGLIYASNTVVIGSSGGGGGCPYVYAWNGTGFVKDNNILPASETGNGTDTKDYYLLQQPLVPVFTTRQASVYSLQIREFENEQDYVDQAKLLIADHSQSTSIAVTPEGEILTYTNPASPISCIGNNGADRLSEIATTNGNVNDPSTYFQGYEGDWLLLNFGRVTAANANLILRDDQKCADVCINVQVPDGNAGWQTVEVLHPRDFWAVEAVNMTAYLPASGNFIVRLLWTATHRLDYVGLDTSPQAQVHVSSALPMRAVHSTMGDVTRKLLSDDENCVKLVNGQKITLWFTLPNKAQGATRDFILYTDGYYYTITP